METLKNIYNWFVYSSANPEKIAMTVKGILLGIAPFILIVLQARGYTNVGSETINEWITSFCEILTMVLGAVSTFLTVVGLVRKLWKTVTGSIAK